MNKKLLLSLGLLSLGVSTSVYSEHSVDHKKEDVHELRGAVKRLKASWSEEWNKYEEVLKQKLKASGWANYSEWNVLNQELNIILSQLKSLSAKISVYDKDPVFKKAQREALKEVFGDKFDKFKRRAKRAYEKGEEALRKGAKDLKEGAKEVAYKAKKAAADAAQKAADALK